MTNDKTNLFDSINKSLKLYWNQFKEGTLQVKVGMIADVLQILTYTAIVSALVTVLEWAYLTKFMSLFFIGLIIVIYLMVFFVVYQPISNKLEKQGNSLLAPFITVLYFALGIYGLGVVPIFFYTNLSPMIEYLKSLL